jgi:hypothetical protein
MNETGNHYVKQKKPDQGRQILHVLSHVWNIDLKTKMKDASVKWEGDYLRVETSRRRVKENEGQVNMNKVLHIHV